VLEVVPSVLPNEVSDVVHSASDRILPEIDMPLALGHIEDDADFVDWLNSVDWTKAPWANSSSTM